MISNLAQTTDNQQSHGNRNTDMHSAPSLWSESYGPLNSPELNSNTQDTLASIAAYAPSHQSSLSLGSAPSASLAQPEMITTLSSVVHSASAHAATTALTFTNGTAYALYNIETANQLSPPAPNHAFSTYARNSSGPEFSPSTTLAGSPEAANTKLPVPLFNMEAVPPPDSTTIPLTSLLPPPPLSASPTPEVDPAQRHLLHLADPNTQRGKKIIDIITSREFIKSQSINPEDLKVFILTLKHDNPENQREGSRGGPKAFRCLWDIYENGTVRCCGKEVKRRDHMFNHVRSHFNVKPFKCQFDHGLSITCDTGFLRSDDLRRHMRAVHEMDIDKDFNIIPLEQKPKASRPQRHLSKRGVDTQTKSNTTASSAPYQVSSRPRRIAILPSQASTSSAQITGRLPHQTHRSSDSLESIWSSASNESTMNAFTPNLYLSHIYPTPDVYQYPPVPTQANQQPVQLSSTGASNQIATTLGGAAPTQEQVQAQAYPGFAGRRYEGLMSGFFTPLWPLLRALAFVSFVASAVLLVGRTKGKSKRGHKVKTLG